MRCFEGLVYDVQRGAWVVCERCSGSGRAVVYVHPKKAPLTVAGHVILFEPKPWQWGSGSFLLRVGGGSQEWAVALLGGHTPSKNPRPGSKVQAYIAYLPSR
jgi:hypothetical protein